MKFPAKDYSSGKYSEGDVAVSLPRCDDAMTCDHNHELYLNEPTAYLPHSCDEWVIGGADEIRAMIRDLQGALAEIEETQSNA